MHHSRIDLRTIDSTNPPAKLHLYFEGKLEVTLNKKPKFSTLKKKKSQKPIIEKNLVQEFQTEKN